MVTTADALVATADAILARIDPLSAMEISKKGRKYKFVHSTFQRIREEDKHLVVHPQDLSAQLATVLAHSILCGIGGDLFTRFRDLSLSIVGCARELERNHWYEEENSLVINFRVLKVAYDDAARAAALDFAAAATPQHLGMGYVLLYCAKLNFLHTDHHVGTRLEGHHMREYVEQYYGADALELAEVLTALKCFVHWANIKGVLWKLQVPHMDVDAALAARFALFPDPPEALVAAVYDRYPSGTSKYSLVRKLMDILGDFCYARLVPWPQGAAFRLEWLFDLCHSIEADPARYHLRSQAKRLHADPVSLQDLSQRHDSAVRALLLAVALVLNTFPNTGGEHLLQNSKLPPFSDALIAQHEAYYAQLLDVSNRIDEYELKGWLPDDIVQRLYSGQPNVHDEVERMRDMHPDDYE